MTMRVVIADDEPLARVWLRKVLESQGATVVAEAETGVEAVSLCEVHCPEALFTDVRMPDLSGLEAAAAISILDPSPRLVFVTGYADHAVDAFEKTAFDYILKPVSEERIAKTLARIRAELAQNKSTSSQLTVVQRLPVRTDYAMRLLRVADIECAIARQKRVYIKAGLDELKTNYTLTQLEQLLPSNRFQRVHASVIVQLDRIEQINFLGNHTYNARLTSGLIVPVGRTQYPEIQRRMGISP
jgi:two-component system, LytTR family, response regulator